jgi:GAF domain-containing protein
LAGKSNSLREELRFAETSAMSLTRKAPTAAKKKEKPQRQDLAQALAEREAELAETSRQQAALAEVLQIISDSPGDLAAAFDAITEIAVRLCDAAFGGLWAVDGDVARAVTVRNLPEPYRAFLTREPAPLEQILGRAAGDRPFLQIEDLSATPAYRDRLPLTVASVELGKVSTYLGIPLREAECIVGIINLMRTDARPFSDKQIAVAQSFAVQAQIALKNARLFREAQEALERQTATADILKVIASSPTDVRPVFEAIAASANTLIGGFSTAVLRFVGETIHLAAFTPTNPAADEVLRTSFPQALAEFPPFVLVRGGETIQFADSEADSVPWLNRELARLRGYRSMLIAPLMSNDAAIGMISVTRRNPGAFAPHHVQLLQTFADQAVIAINNVGLFNETQEALKQQTATADVLKVISRSAFDLDVVLATLTGSARTLCGAANAAVFMRDRDVLRLRAESGCSPAFVEFLKAHPIRAGRETFTGRVMLSGEAIHLPDVMADPEYNFGPAPQLGNIRAALGIPLLRDGRVEGVFTLARPQPNGFTTRQIDLVKAFADQALIAIENVRLFDEVQAKTRDLEESLTQQTTTAEVLKVISRSAFDLQTVFESLISTAMRLCSAKQGVIFRRQGEIYRYAASHMLVDPTYRAHEQRAQLKAGRGTLIGRVALENRAVQIPDAWTDPEYAEKDEVRLGNVRAMLGVPLMRNGEPIGAFALGRGEPVPFTERQVELVATFADQAVIAIENVRLFDEVQAKTRDLEESLQQQTATADVLKVISRSAFDLQAVLDTLASSAAGLIVADFAVMNLRRDDAIRVEATFGCAPEFVQYLADHAQRPGRKTLAGRVFMSGEVQNISDVLADPEYDFGAAPTVGNFRALLGVPMFRDGKVEGHSPLAEGSLVPSLSAKSSLSRPSPTKPSSPSKTHACSTKCRPARETSRRRCNSRRRPPTCSRRSAGRPSTSIRCSKR